MNKTVELKIADIRRDGGTQLRVGTSEDTISLYAEAMRGGAAFPDIIVFQDTDGYWVADGFQRIEAKLRCKLDAINAQILPTWKGESGRRAALLYACGANEHPLNGLRRTNEDKRRAVLKLLEDEMWRERSDRWIAEVCRVSHTFVQKTRPTGNVASSPQLSEDAGEVSNQKPKSIRHRVEETAQAHPSWSQREIAAAVGTSQSYVSQILAKAKETGEERVGRDGKTRRASAPEAPIVEAIPPAPSEEVAQTVEEVWEKYPKARFAICELMMVFSRHQSQLRRSIITLSTLVGTEKERYRWSPQSQRLW